MKTVLVECEETLRYNVEIKVTEEEYQELMKHEDFDDTEVGQPVYDILIEKIDQRDGDGVGAFSFLKITDENES